jgi:DNA-binding beta-propeller fold protein YncE
MKRLKLALLLSVAVATLGFLGVVPAMAEGPDTPATLVLEPLPPAQPAEGQESVILAARLHDAQGEALAGRPVTFYVLTTVFGERLMNVGQVLTDAAGVAAIPYTPSWEGAHTVVVRLPGAGAEPVQTSFKFDALGPVPLHENARFGLEPIRAWLPAVVGGAVLATWAILGLVMLRALTGIPAAAGVPAVPSIQSHDFMRSARTRPAPLGRGLVLVALAMLVAIPAAWMVLGQGSNDEVKLSTQGASLGAGSGDHAGPDGAQSQQSPLSATLVRSVNLVTTDSSGALAPGSADLPSDVALLEDGRLFVLDSNRGRILAVTADGKAVSMFESDRGGEGWLGGALALASQAGRLYVANMRAGNVEVVAPPGVVESVITPHLPPGQAPVAPAGIALTESGEIWLSDMANHQVLLLDGQGEIQGLIGEGAASSGDSGFNTPGGLALDELGNLYVADTGNGVVKQYSPLGVFLGAFGEGRLARPRAVAVDDAGNLFVSDEALAAVLAFGPDGTYLGSIGGESAAVKDSGLSLQAPLGLRVDGDLLYVVDRLSGLLVFRVGGPD